MKKMVVLAMLCLLATSAAAGLDPDPNMLGFYWDLNGDTVCTAGAPIGPATGYILYTNPTIAATTGFEAKVSFQAGAASIVTATLFPVPGINVGDNSNIIVGFGSPVPCTPATLMATVNMYVLDAGGLDIYLGPTTPESPPANGLPKVVDGDANVVLVGLSAADGLVAQYNGIECKVVADEEASFGNVKALFR